MKIGVFILFLFCILTSLIYGISVPLYVDEIQFRMVYSRILLDKNLYSNLTSCYNPFQDNFTVPFLLYPIFFLRSIFHINFENPFSIRIAGILCALTFYLFLYLITVELQNYHKKNNCDLQHIFQIVAFGLLASGLFPLVMVLNRPEQDIITASTIALYIGLRLRREKVYQLEIMISMLCLILLAMIICSVSPKGLFFLLVPLTSLWGIREKKRKFVIFKLLVSINIFFIGFKSFYFFSKIFNCPNNYKINQYILKKNIFLAITSLDFTAIKELLIERFVNLEQSFDRSIIFTNFNSSEAKIFLFFSFFPFILGLGLFLNIPNILKNIKSLRSIEVLPISVFLSTFLLFISTGIIAFYEILYLLFCITIILFFINNENKFHKLNYSLLFLFLTCAFISTSLFYYSGFYSADSSKLVNSNSLINNEDMEYYFISEYKIQDAKKSLPILLNKCGINNPKTVFRPIVDELTYFTFKQSVAPVDFAYNGYRFSSYIPDDFDLNKFSTERDLNYLIIQKLFMNPSMIEQSICEGNYCCMKLDRKI